MVGAVIQETPKVQWELTMRAGGQPEKSRYRGQAGQGICWVVQLGQGVGAPVPCSGAWPEGTEGHVSS